MTPGEALETPEHLGEVQDENGTDLSLLRHNLTLSLEERFAQLEAHQRQVEALLGRAKPA